MPNVNEKLYINESKEVFDVLIVGSGITGGWAAKEFCERGFKTLMIERGRVVEHRKDYIGENKGPWEFENRMKVDNLLAQEQHKIQRQCYAFSDSTKHFFGNDRDLPYSTEENTKFTWIRANQLGGKSLLWHRQSYRFNEHDFTANLNDGHGNDWPIRYNDLDKWYSYVEKHAGISGNKDGLSQLPDGDFLPPFQLKTPEIMFKNTIAEKHPDIPVIVGRAAHLTQPTEYHLSQGRGQCMARNECQKGCSFGGYFSSQSSTLPDATKTGNLHIAPNSVVHSIIYDEKTNRAKGVRVIDNETLEEREYLANIVFLCASTLGSTQILLNSTSKKFPNGLANSSGVLGHYLMDHNYNAYVHGEIPGFEDEYYSGRAPSSLYIPNFQYKPSLYKKNYIRGYAFAGGAARADWRSTGWQDGIGVDFKHKLTQAGVWGIGFGAQGEMLPRFENSVSLHATNKDKWGIPQLHINCTWSENELRMMEDAAITGEKLLKAAGCINIKTQVSTPYAAPGLAIHEVGTARMGRDPKDSVLNGFNQSHDVPNLFVTDGSSFCSSAVVNPSLTFMAMTARAVDYCAKEVAAKRI